MSDITWAAQGVTFENFDPNAQFASKPMWGMFDGHRFKTYTSRGHALNSVRHHGRAKLYEQTVGGWVLRATKDAHNKPTTCANCFGSTVGPHQWRSYDYAKNMYITATDDTVQVNTGEFVFRKRGGKAVVPIELLFVCNACKPVVSS